MIQARKKTDVSAKTFDSWVTINAASAYETYDASHEKGSCTHDKSLSPVHP